MHRRTHALRGRCLVNGLIGVAVVGLLLLVASAIVMVVQGSKAAAGLGPLTTLSSSAAFMQAPGSIETKLAAGNVVVALASQKGAIRNRGGAAAPVDAPPLSVTYAVTITDPEGKAVEVKTNPTARELTDLFYLLGHAEIPKDGLYKVEVKASDDTTPADIAIASMATADFDAMRSAVWPIFWSSLGCGGTCIGGLLGLVGLIGVLIARKLSPPPADPLAA